MTLPTESEIIAVLCEQVDVTPEDEHVIRAADAANTLVTDYLGKAGAARIPHALALSAMVECGAAVYYRRTARNGITSFGTGEVIPIRISKDPMSTVYPMLSGYTTPGISR